MATKISDLTEQTVLADTDLFLTAQEDSNNKKITWKSLKDNFPFDNYINGFVLSNDSGDTAHDINITAGVCMDSTNGRLIRLSSEITKRADSAWSVGDDAGGMDTGTVTTSTLYAVWIIKRSDTGVVDALFSTSFSSPTMPTDYDYKRILGWVLTDGSSNIIQFLQQGDGREPLFRFQDRLQIATGLASTTFATQAVSAVFPTASGRVVGMFFGTICATATDAHIAFSYDGTNTIGYNFSIGNYTSSIIWEIGVGGTFAGPIPPNGNNIYYAVNAQSHTLFGMACIFQR